MNDHSIDIFLGFTALAWGFLLLQKTNARQLRLLQKAHNLVNPIALQEAVAEVLPREPEYTMPDEFKPQNDNFNG